MTDQQQEKAVETAQPTPEPATVEDSAVELPVPVEDSAPEPPAPVEDSAVELPVTVENPAVVEPPATAESPAVPEPPLLPPTALQEQEQDPRPVPAKKDRRVLRAVLRWTAAVVVFAVVGAGTAYGITDMKRSDVPGLGTESDGRWDYPVLTKPPLPKGSPGPLAEANPAGSHFADLRALVLPAPKGATGDKALDGSDGWLATKVFLAEFSSGDDRTELAQKLTDDGLRHIAARGWTTPDGTHTRIYLLQFDTATVADGLVSGNLGGYAAPTYPVNGADSYEPDDDFPDAAKITNVSLLPYAETKPYGAEQIRLAFLTAGDTVAMIVQSRKGETNAVPFQQTVTLQSQLLG
ncbi:hypothetical protein [Streptomyces sp. NPDC051665]|uniref:hypothetical protein n=1 Tax=Streptomyces sp. NPDC051665 TaxID=3154647 RepID=UPI00341C7E0C